MALRVGALRVVVAPGAEIDGAENLVAAAVVGVLGEMLLDALHGLVEAQPAWFTPSCARRAAGPAVSGCPMVR